MAVAVEHARRLAPGLLYAGAITLVAFAASHYTRSFGIGATALGVLLGVVAGNARPVGERTSPGVAFAGKRVLALAVVLLGLEVTVADLLTIGLRGAAIVVGVVGVAIGSAIAIGRVMGVPGALAGLIGAGTGICGASAIAAVRGAVGANERDVSYAIASITFLGSVGLLAYPALQLVWGLLSPADFGILSGATLHSTPQAIGAAFAGGGDAAGAPATVIKLARVVLLGPVAIALAMIYHHPERVERRSLAVPVEVWGFVALFALGSLVALPTGVLAVAAEVTDVGLVLALTALGLATRFSDLRAQGIVPFALALAVWGILLGAVGMVLDLTA